MGIAPRSGRWILEDGLTTLPVRGDGFELVFAAEQGALELGLQIERGRDRQAGCFVPESFGRSDGVGVLPRDLVGKLKCVRHGIFADSSDEAEGAGFLAREAAPGKREFFGDVKPDPCGEGLRHTHVWNDPPLDLHDPELCVGVGVTNVCSERELELSKFCLLDLRAPSYITAPVRGTTSIPSSEVFCGTATGLAEQFSKRAALQHVVLLDHDGTAANYQSPLEQADLIHIINAAMDIRAECATQMAERDDVQEGEDSQEEDGNVHRVPATACRGRGSAARPVPWCFLIAARHGPCHL